jgi:hypothetical protein
LTEISFVDKDVYMRGQDVLTVPMPSKSDIWAPRKMKNFKLAVIYKKTPYGAKGSTKLHTKMTGKVSGGFR